MVRAFTSYRLRNNPFMHRHLRHVHSPDAFDSMANESNQSRHRKPRVGVHGRQRKQLRASPSKTFNFARNQARWRGGSKQWRREPGAGSRCEKKTPGEADLQDDARLVARLVVKIKMGSCG